MNDLISRQAAIKDAESWVAVDGCEKHMQKNVVEWLKEFPSAQSEIIRCKDCKHFTREDIEEYTPYGFYNTYFHAFCDKHWDEEQSEYIDVKLDDFCSFAERREDG